MQRRGFLAGLGAAAWAALRGSRRASATLRPARLAPLGVQLYTVRAEMQRDLEHTLALVAAIGYREVEFWNYYGRTPSQIAALLRQNGLVAPSVHVGLEALEGDAAAPTLAAAREIGHEAVIVAWTPPAWRRTLDDWRGLAERFARAGERVNRAGLRLGYHNHDFEFAPLDGRVPFELLCDAVSPDLLAIQLDIYWMIQAGQDPVRFFGRRPGRIPSVHVKDRSADGRMVDVGAGTLDWPALLGAARGAGVRHWYVEHDEPADGLASIRASYEYLSRLDL